MTTSTRSPSWSCSWSLRRCSSWSEVGRCLKRRTFSPTPTTLQFGAWTNDPMTLFHCCIFTLRSHFFFTVLGLCGFYIKDFSYVWACEIGIRSFAKIKPNNGGLVAAVFVGRRGVRRCTQTRVQTNLTCCLETRPEQRKRRAAVSATQTGESLWSESLLCFCRPHTLPDTHCEASNPSQQLHLICMSLSFALAPHSCSEQTFLSFCSRFKKNIYSFFFFFWMSQLPATDQIRQKKNCMIYLFFFFPKPHSNTIAHTILHKVTFFDFPGLLKPPLSPGEAAFRCVFLAVLPLVLRTHLQRSKHAWVKWTVDSSVSGGHVYIILFRV